VVWERDRGVQRSALKGPSAQGAWQRRCTHLQGRLPPSRGTAQPAVSAQAMHRRPSRGSGRLQSGSTTARGYWRGAAATQRAARVLRGASMPRTCVGGDGGRKCCVRLAGPRDLNTALRSPPPRPGTDARGVLAPSRDLRLGVISTDTAAGGCRTRAWRGRTRACHVTRANRRSGVAFCHLERLARALPVPFSARSAPMAASSWDTYEASKALLAKHGSVAGVKAAAATDASVVKPLTVGLDKWSAIDAAIVEAAKDVDIVIPVRSGAKRAPHSARGERGNAPCRKCRRFGSRAARAAPRRRSATWTSWSSGATSCCRTT